MLIAWLAPAVAQVLATESARAQVRGSAVPPEVPAAPRRWFATAYRFASFAPSFHVAFRAEPLAQLPHWELQWRDCNRCSLLSSGGTLRLSKCCGAWRPASAKSQSGDLARLALGSHPAATSRSDGPQVLPFAFPIYPDPPRVTFPVLQSPR